MDLAQEIKQYYFDNADSLPRAKRFHFASRIAGWEGDKRALRLLAELRPYMYPSENNKELLSKILTGTPGNIYTKNLRLRYFNKYPQLFGIHNALFRVRHLKQVYGIDISQTLIDLVGDKTLEELYDGLIRDPGAMRVLSRFAIDYIYLYEILFEKTERLDPGVIKKVADGYELDDDVQRHLLIYLYTHAIIADTNFYARVIPKDRLEIYRAMLGQIESIVSGSKIKFDNKFEFLVACRICKLDSPLFQEVYDKVASSLNPDGCFIFDPLVGDMETKLNSFVGSEHRNVLFVMGSSPFNPHPTLVS